MSDIHTLDQETVERIAAGEVVERPASVVKELVENSLDAGATRVEVAVEAGGTDGIRVTDDGLGMTEEEVRRAIEEHTTSKIADIGDLEGGVGTLGFRGEALHAIGAVSRLTVRTRPNADSHPDGGGRGTELTVEGGDVTAVDPAGCPEGTTVEVQDLFYNVPARRKYLKQESTEFAHVNTVVTSYALANPDVAVTLTHDGRETFATTGSGDLQETVLAVYGREVAESMVSIADKAVPEGPLDGVSGLVSHPETNRASRDYLSTFVNGRYVTSTAIRDAVVDAYGAQLASDRYPFAVVDVAVDPADVDVNVHPRKLEVRFADEESIRDQVRTAVEETLLDAGLVRSSAPRGRSAPEQTEISPGDDGDELDSGDAGSELDSEDAGSGLDSEDTSSSGDASISGDATSPPTSDRDSTAAIGGRSSQANGTNGGAVDAESPGAGADGKPDRQSATLDTGRTPRSADPGNVTGPSGDSAQARGDAGDDVERAGMDDTDRQSARDRKFRERPEQARLGDDDGGKPQEFDSLPAMRVLGQLHGTYVVAETADGLVLIDQHAADERVNYERLRDSLAGDVSTQVLAEPVRLSLTAQEAGLFEANAEALARLGFRAERVGDRTVEVRTVPSLVAGAADPDLLRDVLAEFAGGKSPETVEAAVDDLLADLACYPSITGNTSLTEGSVLDLLERLDDCENPYACPHGRPVVVEFDSAELEARFERDYPGHSG